MKIEESRPLTMIIQEDKCAFGTLKEYNETEEQYQAIVEISAGQLIQGEVFTIVLHPYMYEQGTPYSKS